MECPLISHHTPQHQQPPACQLICRLKLRRDPHQHCHLQVGIVIVKHSAGKMPFLYDVGFLSVGVSTSTAAMRSNGMRSSGASTGSVTLPGETEETVKWTTAQLQREVLLEQLANQRMKRALLEQGWQWIYASNAQPGGEDNQADAPNN